MTEGAPAWDDSDDCESSTEFQSMAVAARGTPERTMGAAVIPAAPPDWIIVRRAVDALSARTPLHVAALVIDVKARAGVDGVPGLHAALVRLDEALDSNWAGLYPPPDDDDPDDPWYARINLLRELAEDPLFVESILRLPLLNARGIGVFSARDIDVANGKIAATDEEKARCQLSLIRGAAQESDLGTLGAMRDAIGGSVDTCRDLERVVAERIGEPGALSLDGLSTVLVRLQGCFADVTADVAGLDARESEPDEAASVGAGLDGVDIETGAAGGATPGSALTDAKGFGSRSEVLQALSGVAGYYHAHEPSSPVAVLAERASALVGKGFFDVLQDLAAEAPGSFAELVDRLHERPLHYLIEDSYRRFSASESVSSEGEAGPALGSRTEVVQAFERIDLFYRQCEPASPVPLVVAEMRKLVPRGFTELLAEFALLYARPVETDGE